MADGRIMYEPRFPTIPSFDSQGANSIPIFRALKDSISYLAPIDKAELEAKGCEI